MKGHAVQDREPLPGWDSGLGPGGLYGLRPGNLESPRKGLSRGVTALDAILKKIPLPSVGTKEAKEEAGVPSLWT